MKKRTFPSGAERSTDADNVRYDLITPIGLQRLAETYKEGADKYGDWNWMKGFPASDLMNHVIKHIFQWLEGDTTEDHLAHATWGLMTIMHFEDTRPDLIDIPLRSKINEKSASNASGKLYAKGKARSANIADTPSRDY